MHLDHKNGGTIDVKTAYDEIIYNVSMCMESTALQKDKIILVPKTSKFTLTNFKLKSQLSDRKPVIGMNIERKKLALSLKMVGYGLLEWNTYWKYKVILLPKNMKLILREFQINSHT